MNGRCEKKYPSDGPLWGIVVVCLTLINFGRSSFLPQFKLVSVNALGQNLRSVVQ